MKAVQKANIELLDALGVEWCDQSRGVVGVTLRLGRNQFPTLTVHRVLTDGKTVASALERFQLRPIEQGGAS